eukprot:TRINITY_DN14360_c0_g2_i1.p1 TRINITY_DN14360_c0_g2~~TRINITY_DN14360_c0_g2_i1.p1  ORF type:complete len:159 (+),score=37.61 TRINITY_DN14360_c0_g2_i1:49-525(+)
MYNDERRCGQRQNKTARRCKAASVAGKLAARTASAFDRAPSEVAEATSSAVRNSGGSHEQTWTTAGEEAAVAARAAGAPPGSVTRARVDAIKAAGGAAQDVVELSRERKEEDRIQDLKDRREKMLRRRREADAEAEVQTLNHCGKPVPPKEPDSYDYR